MSEQIVFVDDSKSVLKTIEILLKNRVKTGEIEIRTFSKTTDFLDAVESNSLKVSLLFLDINMPVMSGYDLLQKIRQIEIYKEIPVIALTTENTQEALENGKELGFNDWIVKINALNTLQKSINMAIDKYIPKKISVDENEGTNAIPDKMHEMFIMIDKLNTKLLAAEESKSRFLSLMHNEFNNPLMSITMLIRDIINDQEKTKEDILDSVNMVFTDILTLNSQLSNILAGAEIESAMGISKHFSKFSMNDMLEDIIASQQFIHKDKCIEVDILLSFTELIDNDRDKCFLIFQNLIENAFEFSPEGSKITIKGDMDDKNIIFSVYNMGNHIQDQNQMFDPFYNERSDFSRIHHGLGLGLAIVKHLVNFLDGTIIYSVDEGHNLFKVSLPVKPEIHITELENRSEFVFEDDMGSRY